LRSSSIRSSTERTGSAMISGGLSSEVAIPGV
jgi:hypothetical protein